MSTALTVSRANEIYAKIENPMLAVAELGKLFHQSAIMGVSTPGDGAVLALTCMCEGITPLEFAKTYHIINGRPSMRADMMHAKFRSAGGKVKWINTGDDGKVAKAVFAFDGQELETQYTIEDARNVVGDKVDKADSNWRKDRGAMLRARLITKAIRILAPELIAGVYTPEELEESSPRIAAERNRESEIAARRQELLAGQSAADVVIDVIATPVTEAVSAATTKAEPDETSASGNVESPVAPVETAPFADPETTPCTNEQLQELVSLAVNFPSQADPSKKMSLAEIAQSVCKACKVTTPNDATMGQVNRLIARFREQLSKMPS